MVYRVQSVLRSLIELKAVSDISPLSPSFRRGWRARTKGSWPRAIAITRTNHGVGNVRIGAHANLPARMGGFNCRVEIDLSPRSDLACLARKLLFDLSFFFPFISPFPPLLPPLERVSAFSRYGNTYRYYATSVAEPPKSNMKSRERWNFRRAAFVPHRTRSTFYLLAPLRVVFRSTKSENSRRTE